MSLSIRQASAESGFSPDTLRYYEKIGLLPEVTRDDGGRRRYSRRDLDRLSFVRRARRMNFSLAEISELLKLRDGGLAKKAAARGLAETRLAEVENQLAELELLRNELQLLINLCQASGEEHCPIVDELGSQAGG